MDELAERSSHTDRLSTRWTPWTNWLREAVTPTDYQRRLPPWTSWLREAVTPIDYQRGGHHGRTGREKQSHRQINKEVATVDELAERNRHTDRLSTRWPPRTNWLRVAVTPTDDQRRLPPWTNWLREAVMPIDYQRGGHHGRTGREKQSHRQVIKEVATMNELAERSSHTDRLSTRWPPWTNWLWEAVAPTDYQRRWPPWTN